MTQTSTDLDALAEKVARALCAADGHDFDEVCGVDADPDEGYCDSSTCVASCWEEHDAEQARRWYLHLAQAVIREAIAPIVAERDALREALVQHNDRLRSAAAIAGRDGVDTNWLSFRGQCHYTLAEYHDLTNDARQALGAPHASE